MMTFGLGRQNFLVTFGLGGPRVDREGEKIILNLGGCFVENSSAMAMFFGPASANLHALVASAMAAISGSSADAAPTRSVALASIGDSVAYAAPASTSARAAIMSEVVLTSGSNDYAEARRPDTSASATKSKSEIIVSSGGGTVNGDC